MALASETADDRGGSACGSLVEFVPRRTRRCSGGAKPQPTERAKAPDRSGPSAAIAADFPAPSVPSRTTLAPQGRQTLRIRALSHLAFMPAKRAGWREIVRRRNSFRKAPRLVLTSVHTPE